MGKSYGFVGWEDRIHHAPLARFGCREIESFSGSLVCVEPAEADADLANASELRGSIALVTRGKCTFPDKAKRVQAAGAIAMIVANNEVDSPTSAFTMGEMQEGEALEVHIPCVMLSFANVSAMLRYAHTTNDASVIVSILNQSNALAAHNKEKLQGEDFQEHGLVQDLHMVWGSFCQSSSKLVMETASLIKEKTVQEAPIVMDEDNTETEAKNRFAFIRWSDRADSFRMQYAPLGAFASTAGPMATEVIKGRLEWCEPVLAHETLKNAAALKEKIVFVERGECTFPEKLERIQKTGAAGAIVANNDTQDPHAAFVMSVDQDRFAHIQLPSVMVSYTVAEQLRQLRPSEISIVHVSGETAGILLSENAPEQYSLSRPPPVIPYNAQSSSSLLSACREGEVEIVQQLLLHGEARMVMDAWGCTPLHNACIAKSTELVSILLQPKLTLFDGSIRMINLNELVNRVDLSGQTALHYACMQNVTSCVEALIDVKASVHLANEGGKTPLHYACQVGNASCMELLISATAFVDEDGKYQFPNVNDVDLDQCTPLHYACLGGFAECALYLIAANADLSKLDREGCSPLHLLCKAMNESQGTATDELCLVFERMIKEGAAVVPDQLGRMPMDLIHLNSKARQEIELMYLREMIRRQEVEIGDLKRENKSLEQTVADTVADQINNQFQLQTAAKERQEFQVQLQSQNVHVQQLQIQMKSMLQYLQKSECRPQSVNRSVLDDVVIGNKLDCTTELDLAEEAALSRELAKKYCRQRKFPQAIQYLKKSLDLYPLPGVQRLLDRAIEKQKAVDLEKQQAEAARRKAESVDALMDRYRRLLRAGGAPQAAVDGIEREIFKLSTLEDGSPEFLLARDWLEWLVSLPWDENAVDQDSFGMKLFCEIQSMEQNELDHKRDAAARVIQNAAREYFSVSLWAREESVVRIQAWVRGIHSRKHPQTCLSLSGTNSSDTDSLSTASDDQDPVDSNQTEDEIKILELHAEQYPHFIDTGFPHHKFQNIKVQDGVKLVQPPSLHENMCDEEDPVEKFHVLQLIEQTEVEEPARFYVWNRWGVLHRNKSEMALKGPYDHDTAQREFERKFVEKTKNAWGTPRDSFVPTNSSYLPLAWPDISEKHIQPEDDDDEEVLFVAEPVL